MCGNFEIFVGKLFLMPVAPKALLIGKLYRLRFFVIIYYLLYNIYGKIVHQKRR